MNEYLQRRAIPAEAPVNGTHPEILHGPVRNDLIRDEVLADILEATAARAPHHAALIFGDQKLTYQELNEAADQVASRLIQAGVRPGQIVGLWLPRGIELLVIQAGIAKSGAAWLPFDADTPVERIGVCLADANAARMVTCAAFAPRLVESRCSVWIAEDFVVPTHPLSRREDLQPTHPAYVLYTSGSTGKPKGIEISQGSICHFLRSENTLLGIRESDLVYQGFSVA